MIAVSVRPGARSPQLYGYDIQVRQAGRVLARIRRAGRCADEISVERLEDRLQGEEVLRPVIDQEQRGESLNDRRYRELFGFGGKGSGNAKLDSGTLGGAAPSV